MTIGPTRAGYIAVAGRPNAGKSTLLNAMVGQKLSIVTAKAQTTWQRVTGIVTSETTQSIFLDTPGLLEAEDLLQESMLAVAHAALRDADVVLLVVDAARPLGPGIRQSLQEAVAGLTAPIFVAVNKVDTADTSDVDRLLKWSSDELEAEGYPISALRGQGVSLLRIALEKALPESPFLYPPDDVATEPLRFFVAELIRETIFQRYREEIPYSVFCQIEEYREAQDPVYIHANIFVERNTQKRILVGEKGGAIKELGREARLKIEELVGRPVYLDLWVKHLPGWRRKPRHLRSLGFQVPEKDER